MTNERAQLDEETAGLGLTPAERRLARALCGDGEALEALAVTEDSVELATRHRAGGALYLRAHARALESPVVDAWHRQTLAIAAHHLQLQATAAQVSAHLAEAGVEWLPFKGYDLAHRIYQVPEERPTGDLDLLVAPADLERARDVLRADGWRDLYRGPRNRAFLAEEGYTWMAVKESHPLLEVHFRLWGLVPTAFSGALFERSRPDESLGKSGRRLTLSDAYLVAAVHVWLSPRYLITWWELARLTDQMTPEEIDAVVLEACRWDLQLPVALASEVSAALWGQPGCRQIRDRLIQDLRPPERWLAGRTRRRLTTLPLAGLQTARLLSGRRSRQRFKGPWRRIWPHPGIVERSTPEGWPWIARRLWFQARWPFKSP